MTTREVVLLMTSLLGFEAVAEETFRCTDSLTKRAHYRIVGGTDADPAAWPFLVGLTSATWKGGGEPFCGGSLIAPQWVLTAGHCGADGWVPDAVRRVDRKGAPLGAKFPVEARFTAKSYGTEGKPATLVNDVMLLKLSRPIDIPTSDLAILASDGAETSWAPASTCASVAGWGDTGRIRASSRLQATDVPIVGQTDCAEMYAGRQVISAKHHICAGYDRGVHDSCSGDSGGPLVVKAGPTPYLLIGIVSFGIGCAVEKSPGVYARVSKYRDWIFSTIEKN